MGERRGKCQRSCSRVDHAGSVEGSGSETDKPKLKRKGLPLITSMTQIERTEPRRARRRARVRKVGPRESAAWHLKYYEGALGCGSCVCAFCSNSAVICRGRHFSR